MRATNGKCVDPLRAKSFAVGTTRPAAARSLQVMLTHRQIANALGCSRQMAANHVQRGCPRTSAEAALDWYHRNIRTKADRKRPPAPASCFVGPQHGSRIREAMHDASACLELDGDLCELPAQIAHDRDFLPTVKANQAVRRHVHALRMKWFSAQ